jgi:hypothetical protein|tara:strand:- start:909 stop:1154 length:246 start_codon:yes stop_codon:yes gene_type:complete
MRPKIIVYCLAIICLIFSWHGFVLVEDVDTMIDAERSAACYTEDQLTLLKEKVMSFRELMILTVVLSVVMSICASFSRRCR